MGSVSDLAVASQPVLEGNPHAIAARFDRCFADDPDPLVRSRMVLGGDEPIYLPATSRRPWAQVVCARGLAQSCLHEAAHWLRAGRARRRLVDYGYWYLPDGRDDDAQVRFAAHEAEIQGLEWLLSSVAGVTFRVSCDNLRSPEPDPAFRAAIARCARSRVDGRLSDRAQRLIGSLRAATGRPWPTAPHVDDVG